MPTILQIETSTDICSVCISKNGEVVSLKETERSYSHSEVIALFIKDCVQEAGISMKELDAVAISQGPGSYTALRIGTATAKGICFSLDIPLMAVGTLDALFEAVRPHLNEGDIAIPMIDARRKEVYRAVYKYNGTALEEVGPFILDENSFQNYEVYDKIHFCGDGVDKAKGILNLKNAEYHTMECSAKHMIRLSEEKYHKKLFEDITYYEPFYYKGANITVQKKNILR